MTRGLVLMLLMLAGCGSGASRDGGISFTNVTAPDPGAPAISPAPSGRYSAACGAPGGDWTFAPGKVTTPDGASCAIDRTGNPGPNKISLSLTCTGGTHEVWAIDTTSGLRIERDTGTKTTVQLGKCE